MGSDANDWKSGEWVLDEDPISEELPIVRIGKMTGKAPGLREFSWAPYFIKNGLLTWYGKGGIGKTTLATAFCAWASVGKFPDGFECDPMNCFIAEQQDDLQDEVHPKILANGGDEDRIFYPVIGRYGKIKMPTLIELESIIEHNNIEVVVLSPLNTFLKGLGIKNFNDDSEVEEILDQLNYIGVKRDCLIIGIKHPNKKNDLDDDQRCSGAASFINSARQACFASVDKDGTRTIQNAKRNRTDGFKWEYSLDEAGHDFNYPFGIRHPKSPYVRASLVMDSIDPAERKAPRSDKQKRIIDWLQSNPASEKGWHYTEIAKALALHPVTMRKTLTKMRDAGLITCVVEGRYKGKFPPR